MFNTVQLPTGNNNSGNHPRFKLGETVIVIAGASFIGSTGIVDSINPKNHGFEYRVRLDSFGPAVSAYMTFEEHELDRPLTNAQLSWGTGMSGFWMDEPLGSGASASITPSAEQQAKWKAEGACVLCGTKREMSIWGLRDCPDHPTKPEGIV